MDLFLNINGFKTIRKIKKIFSKINESDAEPSLQDQTYIAQSQSSFYQSSQKFQIILNKYAHSQYSNIIKVYLALLQTLGFQIFSAFMTKLFSYVFRIAIIIFFKFIIEEQKSVKQKYLFAALTSLSFMIFFILKQSQARISPLLANKIKSLMIMTIFSKFSKFSQTGAREIDIGTAINLLSNDYNFIQNYFYEFFSIFTFPFVISGILALNIIWLGAEGLICVGIPTITMVILYFVEGKGGKYFEKQKQACDNRINQTSFWLSNVKQIKFYCLENFQRKGILKMRNKQIFFLFKYFAIEGESYALTVTISTMGAFIAFYVKSLSGDLSAALMLSISQLIVFLITINVSLSLGIVCFVQLNVVLERFCQIFFKEDVCMLQIKKQQIQKNKSTSAQLLLIQHQNKGNIFEEQNKLVPLHFTNFSGYWENQNILIKNINLQIQKGKFTALIGETGCGKTSLLLSILRQIRYFKGQLTIPKSISYCQQNVFLFAKSVKDNIVQGDKVDQSKLNTILKVCGLKRDMEMLSKGIQTNVGTKGNCLSGGQKARVGLARALYRQAELYLLDNPLAAIDPELRDQIFKDLRQYLRNKTVLFVTHHMKQAKYCNSILFMKDGRIQKQVGGKIEEKELKGQQRFAKMGVENQEMKKQKKIQKHTSAVVQNYEKMEKNGGNMLWKYIFYKNKYSFILITIFCILEIASYSAVLRLYSYYGDGEQTLLNNQNHYWQLIGGISVLGFIFRSIFAVGFILILININKKIHQDMLTAISCSQLSYFDINPVGNILNHFSNDIGVLDLSLPKKLFWTVAGFVVFIVMFISAALMNPLFLIPMAACGAIFIFIYKFTTPVIKFVKKLDFEAKEPIFQSLEQLSNGIIQIRLFKGFQAYINEVNKMLFYSYNISNTYWILVRFQIWALEAFFTIFISTVILVCVKLIPENQQYAVSVLMFFEIFEFIETTFFSAVSVQSELNSVQRCISVVNIPQQKLILHKLGTRQSLNEPEQIKSNIMSMSSQSKHVETRIALKMKNFEFRYRQGLPIVLKIDNISIKTKEKIGVIGRTGAGKSTIINALLRTNQPQQYSQYLFFGQNALSMDLHKLRQSFSIISQMPFLFPGTLRKNLDPYSNHSDQNIWHHLKKVMIDHSVLLLPQKLDTQITNGEQLFSWGEKQLICLARALLWEGQIVILDEPTSNIDLETDKIIQKVFKQAFASKTVIIIAHRLSSISECNRVFEMKDGRLAELKDDERHRKIE